MSETKNYLPYVQAKALADKIVEALRPHCKRIEIAGSIRRERPYCGDIDLVVQGCAPHFRTRLFEKTNIISNGLQNISVILHNGFGIQVFIAQEAAADLFENPISHDTWGTLLMCRTGSRAHNIQLVNFAHSKGYHWNPYQGLYRDQTLIAAATEESIYEALGLPWHPPTNRESLITG